MLRIAALAFFLSALSFGATNRYLARGVGGGGAMSGMSISPYSDLRFVGTDMGILFRSVDRGKAWAAVDQTQAKFASDLEWGGSVGFSADPKVVFFAEAGRDPKRSADAGQTWSAIPVPLREGERILYWLGDSKKAELVLCATTEGLLRSDDLGKKWNRVPSVRGSSRGTVFIFQGNDARIYHASEKEIVVSRDLGATFEKWFTAGASPIRSFTGGSDGSGTSLAFLDANAKACAWARNAGDASEEDKRKTMAECGFVWVHHGKSADAGPRFVQTTKEGGRVVRMAENDSRTIYVTGGDWVRQYGSKVWVSRDAGATWNLRLQAYDWDRHPYRPWSPEKLEYSAIGLDVGWDDNAPFSFVVNQRNSAEAGWTGHYFAYLTKDFGEHWSAPFTEFADTGPRAAGKRWKSTGLEVTSTMRMKFHPRNPKLAYVSVADLGGYVTEDGGESFRISKAKYNTNYDYAFDPALPDRVYAASGDRHDFPLNDRSPLRGKGGIFVSDDRGKKWKRLTPDDEAFNRQFLSVAYDASRRILYGGTQGGGVARSTDQGATWKFLNEGLPVGDKIIPELEIDPRDGTVYALLTGNGPEFSNAEVTGIYRLAVGKSPGAWQSLRGARKRPAGVDPKVPLWLFPSAFAVDFSKPERDVLWLTDIENKGAWLATGVWKSTDGGKNWARMTQFTHPTAISLVETGNHARSVVVSGLYDVSGKWGTGGSLSSTDGGATWKRNEKLPLLANLFGYTPDPRNPASGFFLFFGGGIFYGPLN